MASSHLPNGIYLRSSINATPATDPRVLAALSPDIIPMGQTQPEAKTLIAAYDHFVSHEIDPGESKTRIYLRGKASIRGHAGPVKTEITLKAFPNELIPWPQAWANAPDIAQATLTASTDGQVTVTEVPAVYNPTKGLGRHDTLVAIGRKDPVRHASNWRDLVKHVGQDPALATYNVAFSDPCSTDISLTTRFRLPENQYHNVAMAFVIEAVSTPVNDIDVSLSCFGAAPNSNPFSFGCPRRNIRPSQLLITKASVPKDFDGTITLNVLNDKKHTFGDYSTISLVAYAVTNVHGEDKYTILGAEHIVFNSDTRVKKLLNKFDTEYEAVPPAPEAQTTASAASNAAPYAFYFRDAVNTGWPRPAVSAMSPDIQPMGTTPDPNIQSDLGPQNYNVDVSSQKEVELEENESNYIYVRGTTTRPTGGSARLFAVPASIILHPSQYSQHSVMDYRPDGDPVPAIRRFKTKSKDSTNPVLFTEPFNFANPPPPAAGDHYCLVAEYRPDGYDCNGLAYKWPNEETGDFGTSGEWTAWLQCNPYVCQRNIGYVSNPDAPCQVIHTCFTIPGSFCACDLWVYEVYAINCPIGSYIEVTSTDSAIVIQKFTIQNECQVQGVVFSNKGPGFTCQVTISWFANGKSMQNGQCIKGVLSSMKLTTCVLGDRHRRKRKPCGPFVRAVQADYPNIEVPGTADASKDTEPPKIGGVHRRRVLGETYSTPGGIYSNFTVGDDSLGYSLA